MPQGDLEHVLAHAGAAWEALRGARILLTGGTGFFGSWLTESFVLANERFGLEAELTVLSRDPQAFLRRAPHLSGLPCLRFHSGDVRSYTSPSSVITHVVHGATATTGTLNEQQPLEMLDTIVEGTRHTLDVAVAAGARRFLLISSGAVYGRQPSIMTHVAEGHMGAPDPLDRTNAYGEGKRVAELLSAIYRSEHGLDVVTARCFAFVGPLLPLDAHFAIGNFIRDALQGGDITIGGDGSPYRSYLHAADLAAWLWTLIARGRAGAAYNVGSEEAVTIRQLAETVASVASATLGRTPTISQQLATDPARPAQRYVPSTRRARDELGLRVRIPLDEAVARTIAWHLQHSGSRGHADAASSAAPIPTTAR